MQLQGLRTNDYIEGLGDCCTVVLPGCAYHGRPCDMQCIYPWDKAPHYEPSKVYNQIRESLYQPNKNRALFICGGEIFDGNLFNSSLVELMMRQVRDLWKWNGIIAVQTELNLDYFFTEIIDKMNLFFIKIPMNTIFTST